MTVDAGDILEVVARQSFGGTEDVVNVFQFELQTPTSLTNTEAQDAMSEIMDDFYNNFASIVSDEVDAVSIRISNLSKAEVYGLFSWPTYAGGTATADPTPPGVCALINFSTGISRVTPRKYIGVLTEGNVEGDGTFSAGVVTNLTTAALQIIGTIAPTYGTWLYGHTSPKTASFQPVISGVVSDIPAYQRRRKQGRGS